MMHKDIFIKTYTENSKIKESIFRIPFEDDICLRARIKRIKENDLTDYSPTIYEK